jgi:hypothetical protein
MHSSMPPEMGYSLTQENLAMRISQNSRSIRDILSRYDTLDILANFRFFETTLDPETYTEDSHEGLGAAVEYVATLSIEHFQKHDCVVATQVNPEDLFALRELSHSNLHFAHLAAQLKADAHHAANAENQKIVAAVTANALYVRGHAYPHHLKEILRELAEDLDEVILGSLGFSLTDAIEIEDFSFEIETQRRSARASKLESLFTLLEQFGKKSLTRTEVEEELGFSPPLLDALEHLDWESALKCFGADYVLHSNKGTMLLTSDDFDELKTIDPQRILCCLKQANVSFGSTIRDASVPSGTTLFQRQPFISDGKNFLRISMDKYAWILPRIERLMNPNCPESVNENSKAWARFHTTRDDYLERKTMRLFKRMMPKARLESSLYYDLPDEPNQATAELDGLVVHDNNFVLIECKAGSISDPTRRGSDLKLKADLEKGLGKGIEQAIRASTGLQSTSGQKQFRSANGKDIPLDFPPIFNVYCIVVTLDHMDALFVDNLRLAETVTGTTQKRLWGVGIRDLMVFADVLDSPTQLLHYIDRRNQTLSDFRVTATDELDLLCCYLQQGLFFDNKFSSHSNVQLCTHTEGLDNYYHYLEGVRETPASKPTMVMPRMLADLIRCMESTPVTGSSEAIRMLYDMSGTAREEFEGGVLSAISRCHESGMHRSFAMSLDGSKFGLTYFVFPSEESDQMRHLIRYYLNRKVQESVVRRWAVIASSIDNPSCPKVCGVVVRS